MSKRAPSEKIVFQHILEVRYKKFRFSFMDSRGQMIDKFSKELGATQIKNATNGSRFDLANPDITRTHFFSIENFGFQLEVQDSFESFLQEANKVLLLQEFYPGFLWSEEFARIGTKSSILLHLPTHNIDSLKQLYKEVMVKNHPQIGQLTKSQIVDTAYNFDLSIGDKLAHVLTGPVTFEEAVAKVFGQQQYRNYKTSFDKSNGLMFVIDVGSTNLSSVNSRAAVYEKIQSQVQDIENVFNGFRSLFKPTV